VALHWSQQGSSLNARLTLLDTTAPDAPLMGPDLSLTDEQTHYCGGEFCPGSRLFDHYVQLHGDDTIWSLDLDASSDPAEVHESTTSAWVRGYTDRWAYGEGTDGVELIDPATDTGPASRPTVPAKQTELSVFNGVVRTRQDAVLSAFELSAGGPSTLLGAAEVPLDDLEAVVATRYQGPTGIALVSKGHVDSSCGMCDGVAGALPARAVRIDMSDPASPVVGPSMGWPFEAWLAALLPGRLLVAGWMGNPAKLALVNLDPVPGTDVSSLEVAGFYAQSLHVVADQDIAVLSGTLHPPGNLDPGPWKIQLIDVDSDPITSRGSTELPLSDSSSPHVLDVQWHAGLLWLVTATDLLVLDITDRDAPVWVSSMRFPGS